MKNMFYIVGIMGIVLVSFGTPRWSILKPHEDPSWELLMQVLFQPYFMMFGEVYAGEINRTSPTWTPPPPGHSNPDGAGPHKPVCLLCLTQLVKRIPIALLVRSSTRCCRPSISSCSTSSWSTC